MGDARTATALEVPMGYDEHNEMYGVARVTNRATPRRPFH